MRRLALVVGLSLAVLPAVSHATQLRWINGASNLTLTSASRCTLMVHTAASNPPLPAEWRLLWVTNNSASPALAVHSEVGSGPDTARVCSLGLAKSSAQLASNEVTAALCSPGSSSAAWARYVVDVPTGTNAKLQMVAYVPSATDPTAFSILRSPEATINGGLANSYPPAILHVTHTSPVYSHFFTVAGVNLANVVAATLEPTDGTAEIPLTITTANDSVLTCFGESGRTMPSCYLKLAAKSGAVGAIALAADPPLPPPDSPAALTHMRDPSLSVYPKDFSFFFIRGSVSAADKFHMFYIRQPHSTGDPTAAKGLGHMTSYDLTNWTFVDSTTLSPRANAWDNLSTWAPYIIAVGDTFYMYYTGVGRYTPTSHILQQIGIATSTNLDDATWTRISSPVLTVFLVPWASPDTAHFDGQQLRDPFVMAHPDSPGVWVMLYTAVRKDTAGIFAIGAARSTDLRHWRGYDQPLWNTDYLHNGGSPLVEAPHIFPHINAANAKSWWLFYSTNSTHAVSFQYDLQSSFTNVLTDSTQDATHWSLFNRFYNYLGSDAAFAAWDATEYLKADFYWRPHTAEYVAAYTGADISIGQMTWTSGSPADNFTLGDPTVAAPQPAVAAAQEVILAISELRPGAGVVKFRVSSPRAERMELSLVDVAGRRVCRLLEGPVAAGPWTIAWDGTNSEGSKVGSGIYFARLNWGKSSRTVRVPFLR
jgi:hypothetical protein